MCGIVAFFSNDEQISESSLKLGMDCLTHRGPDGQGFWISPDRRVALGHTRLSIIDINHGEQPIPNQDKTLHIIANGEFYLWSKTILPNYLLRMLGDGVEMAHSIEGRLPFLNRVYLETWSFQKSAEKPINLDLQAFKSSTQNYGFQTRRGLDHKVVELVRNMPVALKIRGLTEKYVLREAAKPFITETMYNRQKHIHFWLPPPLSSQMNHYKNLSKTPCGVRECLVYASITIPQSMNYIIPN